MSKLAKWLLLYFVVCAVLILALPSCGGVSAQPVPQGVQTTVPASGGAGDAMPKAHSIIRDVPDAIGGDRGFVNAAFFVHTLSGKLETALEWASLTILDNRSDSSDGNTASYAQANKLSTGSTFAAVSEASDTTGLPGALVTHEFDSWVTGPDNGLRIGLEVLNGDARAIRGMGRSQLAESTAAIRIGQTVSTPWATWGTGIHLMGTFRESAIKITDPQGNIIFEVKPDGSVYSQGRKL